jgi:hypothetical protein
MTGKVLDTVSVLQLLCYCEVGCTWSGLKLTGRIIVSPNCSTLNVHYWPALLDTSFGLLNEIILRSNLPDFHLIKNRVG